MRHSTTVSLISTAVSLCLAPGLLAQELEEVVVTGSNIRTGAADQIARPIEVISPAEIEKLGPQKLVEALRDIPGFTGAADTAGSGAESNGRSTLNLRGLGSKYTLVLVNGRRFNAVDVANINSIPASAVASVEVLKDGSSSVYGSDAVAGVVNILLDNKFEGLELAGSYGNTFSHDAKEIEGSIKFGAAGERGRVMANINYRDRNGTVTTDMDLGRIPNVVDIGGEPEDRYYTSPSSVILPSGDRVILDYHRFGPGTYSTDPADWIPYDPYDYNESEFNLAERSMYTDHAPERQASAYAYGEFNIHPTAATVFTELLFSNSKDDTTFVTWGLDFYGDPIVDSGPVPASNPWNPFGIDLRDVQYAVPEVGPFGNSHDTDTYRLVTGVKGDISKYSYEIGATYFRTEEQRRARNLYSSRGLLEAINRPGLDAFNPFCNACNTEEQIAGIRVPYNELVFTGKQKILDAKITGPIIEADNSDLAFAAGVEYRDEIYDKQVDPLTLTGDIYFFQESPDHQERSSKALFGELAYHLRGGDAGIPAIHKLTVELSGRFEEIEKVGDTFNPRIAAAWQPVSDSFTLRASFGTSFNAPPIDLLRAGQQLVNDVLFYPQFDQMIPTDVLIGGNPDLDPETAESTNFGVLFNPAALPGLNISIDYFMVRQEDVVSIPDAAGIADGTLPGEVDFSGARPLIRALPVNVAGRNVDGLDLFGALSIDTERLGEIGFSVAATYLTKFEIDNGPGFEDVLDTIGRGGGDFGALPKLRGRAGVSWTPNESFGTELSVSYVGSYQDNLPEIEREVDKFITLDLTANFELGRWATGLSGAAGLLNITDEEPPFVGDRFYDRYDAASANSQGRFFFLSLKQKF